MKIEYCGIKKYFSTQYAISSFMLVVQERTITQTVSTSENVDLDAMSGLKDVELHPLV